MKIRGCANSFLLVAELRRGDHSAARLKLERERVLTPEHQTVEGVLNHFQRWMEHWKVREIFADKDMTQAQRRRRLKEFFNLTTEGVLTHGHDHQKEMVKE